VGRKHWGERKEHTDHCKRAHKDCKQQHRKDCTHPPDHTDHSKLHGWEPMQMSYKRLESLLSSGMWETGNPFGTNYSTSRCWWKSNRCSQRITIGQQCRITSNFSWLSLQKKGDRSSSCNFSNKFCRTNMVGNTLYPMIRKRQPTRENFEGVFSTPPLTTRKNDKVYAVK